MTKPRPKIIIFDQIQLSTIFICEKKIEHLIMLFLKSLFNSKNKNEKIPNIYNRQCNYINLFFTDIHLIIGQILVINVQIHYAKIRKLIHQHSCSQIYVQVLQYDHSTPARQPDQNRRIISFSRKTCCSCESPAED